MRIPHPLAVALVAVLTGGPLGLDARRALVRFVLRALRAGVPADGP